MRRQEALGYWLQDFRFRSLRISLGHTVALWLRSNITARVADLSLTLKTVTKELDEIALEPVLVIDLLASCNQTVSSDEWNDSRQTDASSGASRDKIAVQDAEFSTVVNDVNLRAAESATIRQVHCFLFLKVITVVARVLSWNVKSRSTPLLACPTLHGVDSWLSTRGPSVRIGTPKISSLPHVLRSIELPSLSEHERTEFLHEAEHLKGLSTDKGELLAVFLHVPVELVGRIRFIEKNKTLLYTLDLKPEISRTRLHDMAAIRDLSTAKIHLVAHRTRYQTAFLT